MSTADERWCTACCHWFPRLRSGWTTDPNGAWVCSQCTSEAQAARVCPCGHSASEHKLLDHDQHDGDAEWRREAGVPRWHWICQADMHPSGPADSPYDHVCGCLVSIWEQEPGTPTINDDTPPAVVEMLRAAMKAAA